MYTSLPTWERWKPKEMGRLVVKQKEKHEAWSVERKEQMADYRGTTPSH